MQARTLRAFTALFAFLAAAAFAVPMGTGLSDIVFVDGKTGSDTNNGSMFFPYKTVTNAFARHADSEYLEIVFGSRPNGNVHVSRTNTAFSGPKGMKIANLYLDNENVRVVLDGVGARYLHVPHNTNDPGNSRAIVTLLNGAEVDDIGSGPDTHVTLYSSGYARQYSTNFTDVISLPLVDAASVRSSNAWWWATNTTTVKDALDRLGNIVPVPDDMSATNLYMMWDKDSAMWTWTDALTPYWTSNSVMHWVLGQAYASLYTLTNDYGTKAWVTSNTVSAAELADYALRSYVSSNYVLKSSMTNYLQNDYTNTVNGQIQTNISDLSNNLLTVIGGVSTNVSDLSGVLEGVTNNVFVQATKNGNVSTVNGSVHMAGTLSVNGQAEMQNDLKVQRDFHATNGTSRVSNVQVLEHIGLDGTNISTWSDITSGFEDQVGGLGTVVTQNWNNTTGALYSVTNRLDDQWIAITNLSGEVWTNNRNATNWIHVLSNRVDNATNWIHVLSNRVNNATGTVGWVTNSLAFVSNRLAGLTTTGTVADLNVKMGWVTDSLGSVSNSLTNTIGNLGSVSNTLDWVASSLASVSNMLTGSNFTWSGEGPFTVNPGGESPTNFWIGTNNLYGWFMSWAGGAGGGGEGSGDQGDSTNPPVIIAGDYLSLTGGVLRGPLVIGSNSTMDAAGYNAFVHGSGSSAAGSNAFASGFDAAAPGNSAHAVGWGVAATGSASIAAGVLAKATNDNAFVWSGVAQEGAVPTQYPSHGQGSFSINPVPLYPNLGPLSGFWVGETNMAVLINSLTPLQSFTNFTNSISASLTNFATVGALTNLSNIVAGIIASNEQQVVSGDYLPLTGGTVTGKVTIVSTESGDALAADGKVSFTGQAFLQGHTNTATGYGHAEGANNQISGSSLYSHAEGVSNIMFGATGSHVEGFNNVVSSSYTHVSGVNAGSRPNASNSFVWSGVTGTTNRYFGQSPGSFNINPLGGGSNVWIGTTKLPDYIRSIAGSGGGSGGSTPVSGKPVGIGVFAIEIDGVLSTNSTIAASSDGWTCNTASNAAKYVILGYTSDYIMKQVSGAGSSVSVNAHVRTFNPSSNDTYKTLAVWLSGTGTDWASTPAATITVAKSSSNVKYSANIENSYESDPLYIKFTCTDSTPAESGDTPSGDGDTPVISSSGDLVVTNSFTLVTNGSRGSVTGMVSFAQGGNVSAAGDYAFAAGINARASNNYSFVWGGTSQGSVSHGNSTFNIRPADDLNGFWVGTNPMSWWITNIAQNVSGGGGSAVNTSGNFSATNSFTLTTTGFRAADSTTGVVSFAQGLDVVASGLNSFASGESVSASNQAAIALGRFASATDDYSFVWSGRSADYSSHGVGTFNIDPVGGAAGFWVGDEPLDVLIGDAATNAMESFTNDFIIQQIYTGPKLASSETGLYSQAVGVAAHASNNLSYVWSGVYNIESAGHDGCTATNGVPFYLYPPNRQTTILPSSRTLGGFLGFTYDTWSLLDTVKFVGWFKETGNSEEFKFVCDETEGTCSWVAADTLDDWTDTVMPDTFFLREIIFTGNSDAAQNQVFSWDLQPDRLVQYGSHGAGTFNVNPTNGLYGFWIGNTNLGSHFDSKFVHDVNNLHGSITITGGTGIVVNTDASDNSISVNLTNKLVYSVNGNDGAVEITGGSGINIDNSQTNKVKIINTGVLSLQTHEGWSDPSGWGTHYTPITGWFSGAIELGTFSSGSNMYFGIRNANDGDGWQKICVLSDTPEYMASQIQVNTSISSSNPNLLSVAAASDWTYLNQKYVLTPHTPFRVMTNETVTIGASDYLVWLDSEAEHVSQTVTFSSGSASEGQSVVIRYLGDGSYPASVEYGEDVYTLDSDGAFLVFDWLPSKSKWYLRSSGGL